MGSIQAMTLWASALSHLTLVGKKYAHPVYMRFVDLENACDSVPRHLLREVLQENGHECSDSSICFLG